ncbi:hypothetical protein BDV34DRAFT_145785 [Aspergillus parasiticus]|uniref:Uncharacterized protein n=1 Tax=Aspergillus parasiticus TaxID=5067 RepID=A0A5N6DC12_ASPPA|nr:hypothetical protein BDV34DRAFT_145785 [Aspergillus parasiticus]
MFGCPVLSGSMVLITTLSSYRVQAPANNRTARLGRANRGQHPLCRRRKYFRVSSILKPKMEADLRFAFIIRSSFIALPILFLDSKSHFRCSHFR